MMDSLDARLMRWLDTGGPAVEGVIAEEVLNRLDNYPALQNALQPRPIDLQGAARAINKCWVLSRWGQMRFHAFTEQEDFARDLIAWLLDELPARRENVAHHIDGFIEQAVSLGFHDQDGKPNRPGAVSLASLLLTACYPDDFVDFPSTLKWREFLTRFGCELPPIESYGERLVWVSDFAKTWAKQPPFRLLGTLHPPLWVISGLCWASSRA